MIFELALKRPFVAVKVCLHANGIVSLVTFLPGCLVDCWQQLVATNKKLCVCASLMLKVGNSSNNSSTWRDYLEERNIGLHQTRTSCQPPARRTFVCSFLSTTINHQRLSSDLNHLFAQMKGHFPPRRKRRSRRWFTSFFKTAHKRNTTRPSLNKSLELCKFKFIYTETAAATTTRLSSGLVSSLEESLE